MIYNGSDRLINFISFYLLEGAIHSKLSSFIFPSIIATFSTIFIKIFFNQIKEKIFHYLLGRTNVAG